MANFVGKWNQIERTNVEAFIALLELPDDKKAKAIENAKSLTVDISYSGGALSLHLVMPAATRDITLNIGKDAEYVASSGKKMQVNATEINDSSAKAIVKSADGSVNYGTLEGDVSGDTLKLKLVLFEIESLSTFKKA